MTYKSIKGKNVHIPNIIKRINYQLNKLDLSNFRKKEVPILKEFLKYLDKMKIQKLEQNLNLLNIKKEKEKKKEKEREKKPTKYSSK